MMRFICNFFIHTNFRFLQRYVSYKNKLRFRNIKLQIAERFHLERDFKSLKNIKIILENFNSFLMLHYYN